MELFFSRRPASGLALPLSDGSSAGSLSGSAANQHRQKSVDHMDPLTIAEAKALQRQQAPNLQRLEKRANSVTNRTQVNVNCKQEIQNSCEKISSCYRSVYCAL
jgi:hypothetical protein